MRRPFENFLPRDRRAMSHVTPAPWHGLGSICVVGLACQDLADFEVLVRQTARTSRNGPCANSI